MLSDPSFLRLQAKRCRTFALSLTDPVKVRDLKAAADGYVARAEQIEKGPITAGSYATHQRQLRDS